MTESDDVDAKKRKFLATPGDFEFFVYSNGKREPEDEPKA